jgi:hypothetical protein
MRFLSLVCGVALMALLVPSGRADQMQDVLDAWQ